MDRDIERLAPLRNFWFLRGSPLVQLFNGGLAGVYNWEKFSEDDLELWFVEICLKCRTEFFRVLLDEEGKLSKLLPTVFER